MLFFEQIEGLKTSLVKVKIELDLEGDLSFSYDDIPVFYIDKKTGNVFFHELSSREKSILSSKQVSFFDTKYKSEVENNGNYINHELC